MHSGIKSGKLFLLLAILFLAGCANENPNLVNPPPQTETISVRLLNLAGDKSPRVLKLINKNTNETPAAAYRSLSQSIKPPADSATVVISAGNVEEYRSFYKMRYVRGTNYTLVALPSPKGSSRNRALDTLINLSTNSVLPTGTTSAFISMINAMSDSTYGYTLSLGCPNGKALAMNLQYRGLIFQQEVRAGKVTVSLMKNHDSTSSVLGLYELQLSQAGQYTLIIMPDDNGKEELWIMNQNDLSVQALTSVQLIPERKTQIRAINFSESTVDVAKGEEPVEHNLLTNQISGYTDVGACGSQSSDSVITYVNGTATSWMISSLEVNEKYTALVFDSTLIPGRRTILVPPLYNQPASGTAYIRVVNGNYNRRNLRVAIGARSINKSGQSGMVSGEILASNSTYGTVSSTISIPFGDTTTVDVPINLFSTDLTSSFVMGGIGKFERGKSYLLVLSATAAGEDKISIIEDNETNAPVNYLNQGIMFELVNLFPGDQFITLKTPPAINNNAKLFSTSSLATIINNGSNTITVNNKTLDINTTDLKSRVLAIAAGDPGNIDILSFTSQRQPVNILRYRVRFINAAKGTTVDIQGSNVLSVKNIAYGTATDYFEIPSDNDNTSYIFLDTQSQQELFRINNVTLTVGKDYSIIFGKNASDSYTLVKQEEY